MKKIGIVTLYYKNYNYGGQLQAFAMQKLFSKNGYNAELISYEISRSKYTIQRFKDLGFRKLIEKIRYRISYRVRMLNRNFKKNVLLKKERFDDFIYNIPHSKVYNEKNIKYADKNYDFYVCGSDQIWNPGWWNDILFLDFTKKKKYAYAASIARDTLSLQELKYIKEKTSDFLAISVREKQAQKLLAEEISLNVEYTLDPTLVVEKKHWDDNAILPKVDQKYVLLYMFSDTKCLKEKIYNECKKRGYKVYSIVIASSIYTSSDSKYSDYVVKDAGPWEWLGWIKGAQYVFTDSFHGSVFSILFERKFWCFERQYQGDSCNENSRLYNLCSITGLENRLLKHNGKIDFDEKIDFGEVQKKLGKHKVQSLKFVDNCFDRIKE